MKSWNDVGVIGGIAIDNEDTRSCHQILSSSPGVVHYTVFYAPYDAEVNCVLPENFIDHLCGPTPLTVSGRNDLRILYNQFLTTIRPQGSKAGFESGRCDKSLTFDLAYNEKYKLVGFSSRPTLGFVTEKMTYCNADKALSRNTELQVLQQFAQNCTVKKHGCDAIILFEETMRRLGRLVCTKKLQDDFFEDVDCVVRIDRDISHQNAYEPWRENNLSVADWSREHANRFISVAEYKEHHHFQVPANAATPITAARIGTDHYNIMTTVETMMMEGKSPFPVSTASAMAHYNNHLATWQKFGIA